MPKESRNYILFIKDVLASIEKVERYMKNVSFEEFRRNDILVDAVVRNFEVIGEAVKKIPEKIKKNYPNIEWREATGFRDILIHDYFGIDLESVYETLQNNIPLFEEKIKMVLDLEESKKKR